MRAMVDTPVCQLKMPRQDAYGSTVVLADTEVAEPAPKVLPQLVQPVVRRHAPASPRQPRDPEYALALRRHRGR